MTTERRACKDLEMRSEGDSIILRGYAAVFDAPSQDLGGFIEIVRRGAFSRSLSDGAEILALAHHDTSRVLARRSARTLTLSEDDRGLVVEIRLANTTHARDIAEDIRAGNIDAMSFGFRTRKDSWTRPDNGQNVTRELLDVDLHEVSPVAFPAYPDTSIALRSMPSAAPVAVDDAELRDRLSRARLRLLAL